MSDSKAERGSAWKQKEGAYWRGEPMPKKDKQQLTTPTPKRVIRNIPAKHVIVQYQEYQPSYQNYVPHARPRPEPRPQGIGQRANKVSNMVDGLGSMMSGRKKGRKRK
jgi:hypothetical protein